VPYARPRCLPREVDARREDVNAIGLEPNHEEPLLASLLAGVEVVHRDPESAQRFEDARELFRCDEDVHVDVVGRPRDAVLAVGESSSQSVGNARFVECLRDEQAGGERVLGLLHRRRWISRRRSRIATVLAGSGSR